MRSVDEGRTRASKANDERGTGGWTALGMGVLRGRGIPPF